MSFSRALFRRLPMPQMISRHVSFARIRLPGICLLVGVFALSIAYGQGREPEALGGVTNKAIWIEADSLGLKREKDLVEMIDRIRAMNVDSIYVEVLKLGESYYRSILVPRAPDISAGVPDPLISILKEARAEGKRPLRVFGVLSPLKVYNGFSPVSPPKEHLLKAHPEWMTINQLGSSTDSGKAAWLDPGLPAVETWLVGVVEEVVSKYPLDGIHFDEMRYPGSNLDWGYATKALSRYQEFAGSEAKPQPSDPKWIEWRAGELTELVHAMGAAARVKRKDIVVSASALAFGAPPGSNQQTQPYYMGALQNWPDWCRFQAVDQLVLKNFHSQKLFRDRFLLWIEYAKEQTKGCRLLVGVSGADNYDTDVVAQIRQVLARRLDGLVLFTYQLPARDPAPGSDLLGFLGNTLFSPGYVAPRHVMDEDDPQRAFASVDLPDNDLPPPIPLITAQADEQKRAEGGKEYTQVDATRALLGLDPDEPLGVNVRNPEERDAREVQVPERIDLPAESDGPRIGSGLYEITLSDGMKLEGRILEAYEDGGLRIRLSGRLAGGSILDLPSSRIRIFKPMD